MNRVLSAETVSPELEAGGILAVDLAAIALNPLGAVEQADDTIAAAEREAREGEVVARVRLRERAGAAEREDCLAKER